MGRHPEILRANHQLYFEAFPIFYSGVEMIDPSKAIWRYKSEADDTQPYYYGNGDDQDFSEVCYHPPLSQGVTKPQMLAKFAKILLVAKFFIPCWPLRWRYDEEDGTLPIQSQQELVDHLRKSKVIKDFAAALAVYSWVDHVDLDFGLRVRFVNDQEDPYFDPSIEDPEAAECDARSEIWSKGDIQVADIFLASGILDPLRRISNVRSWFIGLTVECSSDEPPIWHEAMTLDLSDGIEQKR